MTCPRGALRHVPSVCVAAVLGTVSPAWAWQNLLADPDVPVPQLESFPAPDELLAAVRFWSEIFTKHDSDRVVLHDRESLDLIWQVIELPTDADGKVNPAKAERAVHEALADLKARLRRLATEPTPVDGEDRILLALCGGADDPSRLEGAWERVRSQRGVADRFREGLARAKPYLPQMQEILRTEGLPVEIAALPFVESTFNPVARSSVGAVGIWQLMPATAKSLGLKIAPPGDERYDVLKSTRAAAKMLKKNYQMLGTWPLAITAYNHGPNGVRRAVASVGSTDLVYLIDNYEKRTWGFASKNFYAEFLAIVGILHQVEAAQNAALRPLAASTEAGTLDTPKAF